MLMMLRALEIMLDVGVKQTSLDDLDNGIYWSTKPHVPMPSSGIGAKKDANPAREPRPGLERASAK